jgi:hypothetical protein
MMNRFPRNPFPYCSYFHHENGDSAMAAAPSIALSGSSMADDVASAGSGFGIGGFSVKQRAAYTCAARKEVSEYP